MRFHHCRLIGGKRIVGVVVVVVVVVAAAALVLLCSSYSRLTRSCILDVARNYFFKYIYLI